ncbi:DUF6660 family protein [Aquimarina sp. RZ0]|uniref:DUF6660 family protein n=1 Tax=Aquimarina sp. RZ0 TaxID=2607730 RepID=UPI0011F2A148|nr:DUF6660 family protein [Aquimarina sp. RZ0]KAA1244719.1 hypothetical protein F0000_15205 [Aquimarina sp. RZ0]
MRIIILTIYFLGLNFVPCNDVFCASEIFDIEICEETDSGHHHDTDDLCSPFCYCHCCQAHTIDFRLIAFVPIEPTVIQQSSMHFDKIGHDYHKLILQPPKA